MSAYSCKNEEMKAPAEPKPYNAPAFSLTDLSGKQVLLSEFKGKPLLLNFWASWCVPCRAEMPELQNLHDARKDSGLVVLEVNFKETRDTAEKFATKNGLTFRILLDEHGAAARDFQLFGLPTTYFIDRAGVIRHSYMGEMTKEIINAGLKTIAVQEY